MEIDSLPLHELNPKSAGVGAWKLKIHNMRMTSYEFTKLNKVMKAHKLECMLVAEDDTYCQGVIKTVYNKGGGGVDPVAELKKMQEQSTAERCGKCQKSHWQMKTTPSSARL